MKRTRPRSHVWSLLSLIATVALIGVRAPVAAQTTQLNRQRGIVEDARDAYAEAQRARNRAAEDWDANSETVRSLIQQAARLAETEDPGLSAADTRAVNAGYEQSRLTTRLNTAEKTLEQRRIAYRNAIDEYVEQLLAQAGRSPAAEANALRRIISQYEETAANLQPPAPRADWAQFVARDPRDGPEELRDKANLVRRQISDNGSALQRAQQELDRVKRRRQQLPATTSGTFDENQVPVGNAGRAGGSGTAGRASGPGLTLDQQIEQLQKYINELKSRQQQLATREGELRAAAGPQP
jgi:hypothetical protein